MAKQPFTPETIVQIVLEALQNDQDDKLICRKYEIEENTLVQWRKRLIDRAYRLFITMNRQPVESQLEQGLDKIENQRAFGWSFFHDLEMMKIPPPAMVFDIGANIGQTSKSLAVAWPKARIHAFEPIKATFAKLERNFRNHKRVSTHQCAVGDLETQILVHLSDAGRSPKNSILDAPDDTNETELVNVTTIEAFCKQQQIGRIDFLKIDAEGYDLKVLQGAEPMLKEEKVAMVFVEVGFHMTSKRWVPFQDIVSYLHPLGYILAGLYDQNIYKKPRTLALANALFIHKNYKRA